MSLLAALTCSAGDQDSVATTGPPGCVSSYVPVRDPFSSGLPKLKDLKRVSTRPLALITSRQANQGKAETEWKVIEVKVPVGDFWYPVEFERLCEQRCLERNVPMKLPVDEAS